MKVEFDIFIPKNSRRYNYQFLLLGLIMITCALHFLLSFVIDPPNWLALIALIIAVIVFIRAVYLKGRIEPLNGTLKGKLKLDKNSISINGISLDFDAIKSVEFRFEDYYSKPYTESYPNTGYVYPVLLNGTRNWLEITYTNGSSQTIRFQRMHENQHKYLEPFLLTMHQTGKLSLKKLTDYLGIDGYSQIQDFKKKIKTTANIG